MGIKYLFKDTAIYGLSSIVGRFLKWCLVPMYTYCFTEAQYGVVTDLYAYAAIALIILTYGMETGFFRFANHERLAKTGQVYTTALSSLGVSSMIFIIIGCLLSPEITRWLEYADNPAYIWTMVVAVGVDAYTSLPFAYLRYKKRPIRFATLKLLNIAVNIGLNLFFILLCPVIWRTSPEWIAWFYRPDFGIGYIFLANMISSLVVLMLVIPEIFAETYSFSGKLLREMLRYSYPLVILGIAGVMNQTIDKILYPMLAPDKALAMDGLGVYAANYKVAVVMVMFIQAFRFAYEPFIFAQNKEKGEDKTRAYSEAMKWFVIFGLFIFLGVMYFLPVIKYFISPKYFSGLRVVPIIMLGEFFFGIFFNLSLWYKLTDKTIWGTWFSLAGLAVTLILNFAFVPVYGYIACAWAAFCSYGFMMVASYIVGKKMYPIDYGIKRLALYFLGAMALWGVSGLVATGNNLIDFPVRAVLLCIFAAVTYLCEIRKKR